jgi:hypothetical protein
MPWTIQRFTWMLQYLANGTRPYLAFTTILVVRVKSPRKEPCQHLGAITKGCPRSNLYCAPVEDNATVSSNLLFQEVSPPPNRKQYHSLYLDAPVPGQWHQARLGFYSDFVGKSEGSKRGAPATSWGDHLVVEGDCPRRCQVCFWDIKTVVMLQT